MTSAAPQKRMVSSVFITLASPHRATMTQQQPPLKTQSSLVPEKQQAAVRVGPGNDAPAFRHKKEDKSPSDSYGFLKNKEWSPGGPPAKASDPPRPRFAQTGPTKAQLQEDKDQEENMPEPLPPPPPHSALPSLLPEDLALPPPPPSLTSSLNSMNQNQQTDGNKEKMCTQGEQTNGTNSDVQELCGFCRKVVPLSEPAIEALNRIYHGGCFQCRSCHIPLAGKQYYNKAGIPLCESCYQASLELCWTCGEVITDKIIRAVERAYHPSCFTCTTCKKQIGEQAFAQGDVGEVYCLQDYYRKYAPKCSACDQLIIPKEDGTDSYTVECLGHTYHENCYRCEVCAIQLLPEPNEHGCYPLDGKLLCKECHVNLISGHQ